MLGLDKLLDLGRILSSQEIDLQLLPVQKVTEVFHLIRLGVGQIKELAFIRPGQELVHLSRMVAADGAE